MVESGARGGAPSRPHDLPAGLLPLVVGAVGIVFGDLGTSPLYAIREAFESPAHRLAVDEVNVLGAVSIIVWTLVIIIAVKYVLLVLRADNHGEGGILALTALVEPHGATARRRPRPDRCARPAGPVRDRAAVR